PFSPLPLPLQRRCFPKASAKVGTFHIPAKFSDDFFHGNFQRTPQVAVRHCLASSKKITSQ
ncbi:MAG: hypothetical protein K1V84_11075, partial [Muribaculaceae bacterium]